MGMSTNVIGFKPPDDTWRKMKAIYDACHEAGVDPPIAVEDYFEDGKPDPSGVEVSQDVLAGYGALRQWGDEYREGFELDVAKIPKDVKIIRFYNAW